MCRVIACGGYEKNLRKFGASGDVECPKPRLKIRKKNCIFVDCPTAEQSAKGTATGAVWPSYLCRLLVFAG
jgi:putative transposon-encoded protein